MLFTVELIENRQANQYGITTVKETPIWGVEKQTNNAFGEYQTTLMVSESQWKILTAIEHAISPGFSL